jgi:hypothetical protein
VFFVPVGARGVFSLINETFSLTKPSLNETSLLPQWLSLPQQQHHGGRAM